MRSTTGTPNEDPCYRLTNSCVVREQPIEALTGWLTVSPVREDFGQANTELSGPFQAVPGQVEILSRNDRCLRI